MVVENFKRLTVTLTVLTMVLSCSLVAVSPARGAEKAIEVETGLYYTVKTGDTLWDIAEHFYGTPAAWPEVWRQNPQIANPHRLKPGTKIRIFGETRTQKIPVAETAAEEKKAHEPPYFLYNSIDSVGLVRKEPITSQGKIFSVRFSAINSKSCIAQDDIVYIKPAADIQMTPGDSFYVYRKLKPVYNVKGTNFGPQYYVTGIAEVVGMEPGYIVARIVRSFRTISVNDLILPFRPRSRKISITESTPGIDGHLMKNEEGTINFGEGAVAFIDRGSLDQVKVGQIYTVYMEKAFPEATVRTRLGSLLVLHTEKQTSTVLIVQSQKSLRAGVKIRTPLQ
jgi:LysM repeat protein